MQLGKKPQKLCTVKAKEYQSKVQIRAQRKDLKDWLEVRPGQRVGSESSCCKTELTVIQDLFYSLLPLFIMHLSELRHCALGSWRSRDKYSQSLLWRDVQFIRCINKLEKMRKQEEINKTINRPEIKPVRPRGHRSSRNWARKVRQISKIVWWSLNLSRDKWPKIRQLLEGRGYLIFYFRFYISVFILGNKEL